MLLAGLCKGNLHFLSFNPRDFIKNGTLSHHALDYRRINHPQGQSNNHTELGNQLFYGRACGLHAGGQVLEISRCLYDAFCESEDVSTHFQYSLITIQRSGVNGRTEIIIGDTLTTSRVAQCHRTQLSLQLLHTTSTQSKQNIYKHWGTAW